MSRTNLILLAVLAVQVVLGAVTWWPTDGQRAEATPFLDMTKGDVTTLTIQGTKGEGEPKDPITLEKKGEEWVVASAGGYPAQADKVVEIVDKLVALKVRNPIASKDLSQKALKVAADSFGKKVTIAAGGKSVTFFAGAAASNQVHLRRDGETAVYAARGLSEWGIRDTLSSFVDTNYLETDEDSIESLEVHNAHGTFTFYKDAGAWKLDTLAPDQQLDVTKVERLVKKVAKVRMTEPLGAPKPEHGLDTGVRVTWSYTENPDAEEGDAETPAPAVTRQAGLTIGAELDNAYAIKADDNAFVVKVSKYTVKDLLDVTTDEYVAKPEEPSEGDDEG